MKNVPLLFAGVFGSFTLAWFTLLIVPHWQIGNLEPQVDEDTGDFYPVNVSGVAEQGKRVYVENGCFYCHSQQVRDPHLGSDLDRQWGLRRTVARDYLYEKPVVLGNMRNGPDLANAGTRGKDAAWHYRHLYNPRGMVRESMMPPFRYLFKQQKIAGERSLEAVEPGPGDVLEEGFEIVPTDQARALVGYLLSLDKSHPLKEVKEMRTSSEVAAK